MGDLCRLCSKIRKPTCSYEKHTVTDMLLLVKTGSESRTAKYYHCHWQWHWQYYYYQTTSEPFLPLAEEFATSNDLDNSLNY